MKLAMCLISLQGVLTIPSRKRSQSVATAFYGILYIQVCQERTSHPGASCAFCPKHYHEGDRSDRGSLRSGQY